METWHVEYENGCCSAVYDTLEEAKAAIAAQGEAKPATIWQGLAARIVRRTKDGYLEEGFWPR